MIESLLCKQGVGGSSPPGSTRIKGCLAWVYKTQRGGPFLFLTCSSPCSRIERLDVSFQRALSAVYMRRARWRSESGEARRPVLGPLRACSWYSRPLRL